MTPRPVAKHAADTSPLLSASTRVRPDFAKCQAPKEKRWTVPCVFAPARRSRFAYSTRDRAKDFAPIAVLTMEFVGGKESQDLDNFEEVTLCRGQQGYSCFPKVTCALIGRGSVRKPCGTRQPRASTAKQSGPPEGWEPASAKTSSAGCNFSQRPVYVKRKLGRWATPRTRVERNSFCTQWYGVGANSLGHL
jgi:hypothetical protein